MSFFPSLRCQIGSIRVLSNTKISLYSFFGEAYTCLPRKIGRDKNREISILNEAIKDFLSVLSSVTDGWKLDVFYYGMTSEEKKSAPLVCVTDSNSRDNDWTFRGSRIWLRFWRVWTVEKLRVWKSSSCLESVEGLFVSKCWVRSELGEGLTGWPRLHLS